MEEENTMTKIILQARNLYKTEFDSQVLPQATKARILKLKLSTEFKNTIQHMKKEKSTEKLTHQNQSHQTNKNPNLHKNQQQNQQKEVNSIQVLIKDFLTPKTTQKVNTFEKFDKNISTNQAQQNNKQENQHQVAVHKLQMNLSQETRLGTIKAANLRKLIKPVWHAPYKLYRVIVGHQGWVRCLAVSPENQYFATGSADRTIKFWDLASGQLKITLTGHINTVRGLQFSRFHPYLFSCGQDKSVKCWDLQMNKVIRNYHGHLSGVYCLKIHHDLNVLITGGRDSSARVWDIRVRKQIYCLTGHAHTVGSVITLQNEPIAITGSYDSFVKIWDLGMGKCLNTMTNHKKAVRTMVQNPFQYSFATAASDNIKVWKGPQGQFLRNISGHHSIIDSLAINQDGVLVSGGNDGSMKFWDWSSGYCFQDAMSKPQPGSISAENGIFAMTFDRSGTRLITGQCDKTIKMWKQDSNATQQTHPIKSFNMEFK